MSNEFWVNAHCMRFIWCQFFSQLNETIFLVLIEFKLIGKQIMFQFKSNSSNLCWWITLIYFPTFCWQQRNTSFLSRLHRYYFYFLCHRCNSKCLYPKLCQQIMSSLTLLEDLIKNSTSNFLIVDLQFVKGVKRTTKLRMSVGWKTDTHLSHGLLLTFAWHLTNHVQIKMVILLRTSNSQWGKFKNGCHIFFFFP